MPVKIRMCFRTESEDSKSWRLRSGMGEKRHRNASSVVSGELLGYFLEQKGAAPRDRCHLEKNEIALLKVCLFFKQ